MKRINNYRGQAVDTKEWFYGYLVPNEAGDKWYILEYGETYSSYGEETDFYVAGWQEVIPETVGQYTGLMDNSEDIIETDDKEVWKGDIVSFSYKIKNEFEWITAKVKFENGSYILVSDQLPDGYIYINEITENDRDYFWIDAIVVGNIFDNPELLQEVE